MSASAGTPALRLASAALLAGGFVALSALPAHAVPVSEPDYVALPATVGAAPAATWRASSADAARVVADPDLGAALQLTGGGVLHDLTARAYPGIDGSYAAGLDWANFFGGGVTREVDPVTGAPLEPTGVARVLARADSGASLWADAQIAYGDSADDLALTTLTCELPAGTSWTDLSLNDCSSIDDDLDMSWIAVQTWTFNAPFLGEHTFAAGERVRAGWSPAIARLAGLGFHVEGTGSAWIGAIQARGATVGFRLPPAAPVAPAADSDALLALGLPVEDGSTVLPALDPAALAAVPVTIPFPSEQGDEPVDIWAYSAPVHVGSGAVSGGVVATTVDLSSLAAGDHHLVVVGAVTGRTQLYSFAVPAAAAADPDPTLIATGTEAGWPLAIAAAALLAGAILQLRRRRA